MKKLYLSLFFAICTFPLVLAQNYQAINSERTVLFENANHEVQALRIDSIQLDGNDSILFPFSNIRQVDTNPLDDCYSPYAGSWIGAYIIIEADGTHLFFNKQMDTIKVETQAVSGDTWLLYQDIGVLNIMATVSAHDTMRVLGQIDSVKTISLQAYNASMEVISHPANDMELKLSKNYGFVSTLNFYFCPDFTEMMTNEIFENYSLIGMSHPELGVQNLTWFEVYDFQIGDIIQTHEEDHAPDYFREKFISKRYLSRSNYADSIVYQVEREMLTIDHLPTYTSEYILDTIIEKITSNPTFDLMSMEPNLTINSNTLTYYEQLNDSIETKTYKWWQYFEYNYPNCWMPIVASGACFEPSYFLKGLGGGYVDCPFDMTYWINELLYYQKGSEEWGEPIDFSVGIKDIQQQEAFRMMPNPAKDKFRIILDSESAYGSRPKIEILNAQGKLIQFEQIYDSSKLIDISNLEQGLYFVRIGDRIQKLLVE